MVDELELTAVPSTWGCPPGLYSQVWGVTLEAVTERVWPDPGWKLARGTADTAAQLSAEHVGILYRPRGGVVDCSALTPA